jgi:hypothetical protein
VQGTILVDRGIRDINNLVIVTQGIDSGWYEQLFKDYFVELHGISNNEIIHKLQQRSFENLQ